jgi:hypothetical protein
MKKIINGPRNTPCIAEVKDGKVLYIDPGATIEYEKICPRCEKKTDYCSIDGGLTSIFHCTNGCEINGKPLEWVISPFDNKTIRECTHF